MTSLRKLFRGKLVTISMTVMMVLIVLATLFTWINKRRIIETTAVKEQAETVKNRACPTFSESICEEWI